MTSRHDYPNEPIGGGNPYYRCCACKRSDPEINGRLEGHYDFCTWRQEQERTDGAQTCLSLVGGEPGRCVLWKCHKAKACAHGAAMAPPG